MNDKKDITDRLKAIIAIAIELKWLTKRNDGYPTMQLSEVEKCMIAMVDDVELDRMILWQKEEKKKAEAQTTNAPKTK